MLSRELMGLLVLGILWVNTLLIAAVAWKRAGALLARRSLLTSPPPGFVLACGEVKKGNGPSGAIAASRVEQVGRAGAAEGSILFSDRVYQSEVFGGEVETDRGLITVEAAPSCEHKLASPSPSTEVWLSPEGRAVAGACPSREVFDAAFADARKARGFSRTVTASVAPGARVWIAGRSQGGVMRADDAHGLLVAAIDPRAWLLRSALLNVVFATLAIAAAGGVTALALTTPRFGLMSTVGGALGLVFFLLIQPAGTFIRDLVLEPSRAILRGEWRRS